MVIPEVSSAALQQAMDRFDKELRNTPYWTNWKQDETYKYAIPQNGLLYPVKQIVSLATGIPVNAFSGGDQANGYVEARGFNVVEIPPEERRSSSLKWDRVAPESFDLKLLNVKSLDPDRLKGLYESFLSTKWADSKLGINRYLREDLKSWIDNPAKPLSSRVYVTLSNWFLSIDAFKNDPRGKAAGDLWDLLFLCRPPDRLSPSDGGRNHEIIPERFNRWWAEQLKLQGSIKQMRSPIDLSSAEVLRQLYDEFQRDAHSEEWSKDLTAFLDMTAHTSETERASLEFQRKLWEENPVSAVGQGFISVDRAIEEQDVRNWIASKSMERLPENAEQATTRLAELANQMMERLKLYCRQIPYLKIFRVLTAFFPQHFTTIADRGRLRELHLAMFGSTGGPWPPQFETSASHAVVRHANVLARLVEVLGPMNADTAGLVRRIIFPWFLHEKLQERPSADTAAPDPLSALAESLLIDRAYLAQVITLLQKKRQLVFYGPPGTGKTFVARRLGRFLAGDDDRIEIVQFHPSYAYEDFVQGYRPSISDGQAGFQLVDGALKRLADKARRVPDKTHILIIDEVNRGNLGKVFGELYYLLEYRGEKISLLYSRESFTLPKNLLIISTMNTADRSIALLDAALRRRFYFVPFFPDKPPIEGLLRRWLEKNTPDLLWLADVLDLANRKLGDRHIAIGPSYFMDKD